MGISDNEASGAYMVSIFETNNGILSPYALSALTQKFNA